MGDVSTELVTALVGMVASLGVAFHQNRAARRLAKLNSELEVKLARLNSDLANERVRFAKELGRELNAEDLLTR